MSTTTASPVPDDRAAERGLVARAQQGDLVAFEELYRRNVGRVFALCCRLAGDGLRAEELAQDVFVRAWQKIGQFRGDSAFSSWLHPLAVNTALSERRSLKRRTARVFATDDLEAFDRPGRGPGPRGAARPGQGARHAAAGRARRVRAARRRGLQARGDRRDDGSGDGHVEGAAAPRAAAAAGGAGHDDDDDDHDCDRTLDALDDYVDGALGEAAFQEVELHLAGCADCAAEHRMLRELLARAAALPRAIVPPHDLWAGIAGRLAPRRTAASRWTMGLAAAAALAVAVTIVSRPRPDAPAATPATTPVASASEGLPPALEQAEARVRARRPRSSWPRSTRGAGALPPRTVAALEENLKTIDAALAEVRTALRSDPSNPHLNLLLASTHQRKVEVLRQVVRLTT